MNKYSTIIALLAVIAVNTSPELSAISQSIRGAVWGAISMIPSTIFTAEFAGIAIVAIPAVAVVYSWLSNKPAGS